MNLQLVVFLESLKWPRINNRVLSHPADQKMLINSFRKLSQAGVPYSIDDVRNWLVFHKPENMLSDGVIDDIVNIADYVKIDFHNGGAFYA
jgi:hypothetical protein